MKWQILLFILLIPCVYAGNYTIAHNMNAQTGLTVNSNNYSFRFSAGLNEVTYVFNNTYYAKLGILKAQKAFAIVVLNQTQNVTQPHGIGFARILHKTNDCGLTVYSEEMTILNRNVRYVTLDNNKNIVLTNIGGSKLFNYINGTIESKLPLILTDDVYVEAEQGSCKTLIKVPIPAQTIAVSWGILISIISAVLFIILKRKRK